MSIIFIIAFVLAVLGLGLIIFGVPISERAFKIIVLIILILVAAGGTGWFGSLIK